MKKILCAVLSLLLTMSALVSCGKSENNANSKSSSKISSSDAGNNKNTLSFGSKKFKEGDSFVGTTWKAIQQSMVYEYAFDETYITITVYGVNAETGEMMSADSTKVKYSVNDNVITYESNTTFDTYDIYFKIKDGQLITANKDVDEAEKEHDEAENPYQIDSANNYAVFDLYDEEYDCSEFYNKLNGNWLNEEETRLWIFDSKEMTVTFSKQSSDWKKQQLELLSCPVYNAIIYGRTNSSGNMIYELAYVNFVDDDTIKIGEDYNECETFTKRETLPELKPAETDDSSEEETPSRTHTEGIGNILGLGYDDSKEAILDLLDQDLKAFPIHYTTVENVNEFYFLSSQKSSKVNFMGINFSYLYSRTRTTDDNTFYINFYFSYPHYELKYPDSEDVIAYAQDSKSYKECKIAYDMLYEKLCEYYGEPDKVDTGENQENYVNVTWNDTPDGDVWLCLGENLWGEEGYNDVLLSYTQSGFDHDSIVYSYDE